jgi:tetratricopeptide (TPR) repeat protein
MRAILSRPTGEKRDNLGMRTKRTLFRGSSVKEQAAKRLAGKVLSWLILSVTLAPAGQASAAEPPATKAPAAKTPAAKAPAQLMADRAKATDPKDAVAHYQRGIANAKAGRHAEAIADYTTAIELNPRYIEAYYERANEFVRSAEYAKAIADCTQALEHSPRLAEAYYLRGVAGALLPKAPEAQYDLHRAVELKPALAASVKAAAARFKLSPPPLSAANDLLHDMQLSLKQLDYPDTMVRDFAEMLSDWNLLVMRQKLVRATQDDNQGRRTKAQVVQVEQEVAKQLTEKIRDQITFGPDDYDLGDVIAHHKANALGYCQLLWVLGATVGLPVESAYISGNASSVGVGHVASLIDLADSTVIMVDLVAIPILISPPFALAEPFAKRGDYYELKTKDNPLKIHRRMQLLDRAGLLSAVYAYRATVHSEAGQRDQAIADCTKAIQLDPKLALPYYNRGAIHSGSGQLAEAIPDYTQAIQLNPQFAEAYFNRGVAEARLKQNEQSIRDLRRAVELNTSLVVLAKKVSDDFHLGLQFGGP